MGITYADSLFRRSNCLTPEDLKAAKKAIEKVEKASTDEARLKEMKKLLSIFEKGALAIRQEVQQCEVLDGTFFLDGIPECVKDLPVTVVITEDALILKTPITIKKKSRESYERKNESYLLAQYAYTAIKKWQRENDVSDQQLYQKLDADKFDLVFIIKRKAAVFNRNLHCDNDNLENSTIQNEICSALAIGDSCLHIDHIYSCFRVADPSETGTEFIITARKNLMKYTAK